MKLRFKPLVAASAVALAMLAALPAQAAFPFAGLVVFGDSLSDNGNNYIALAPGVTPAAAITSNSFIPTYSYAPGFGYPAGVYSNGPVWATYAATALGIDLAAAGPSLAGGTNWAYGGAVTGGPAGFPPSLTAQASGYLMSTGNVVPSDHLYVVAGGGNDARGALAAIQGGADVVGTIASVSADYAANIGNIVDALQGAGAANIVVWNTPNLGTAPATLAFGDAAAGLATSVAASMNIALATRLTGEVGVTTFDLFGLVGAVIADPAAYGLSNVADACIAGACDAATYLFWDGIHPSTKGHQLIASAFVAQVVPEPGTWLMFAV
ncbi:MAG: SGNH/GDSL hydrolase family protein, partial [Rubrivivax sp.]